MTRRTAIAAHNNALWCDAVCRSHGLIGTTDSEAWSCSTRTPRLYPDAVTLSRSTTADDLLRRIDSTDGASVKDSWACLDLTVSGFVPLVAGEWLWLDAPSDGAASSSDGRSWHSVRTDAEMARWSRAWAGESDDVDILGPALLGEVGIHVLAGTAAGDIVAGCIVNVTGEVAGVTNLFTTDGDDAGAWCRAAIAGARVAPGLPLVGWESGDQVAAARSAGFETIGPLTVWIR